MSDPSSGHSASGHGFVRDPMFIDAYADHVRLGVGLGHVSLIFGIIDDLGTEGIVVRERGAVRLPFPYAKILLVHLQAVIEAYEQIAGEIPTTGNLLEQAAQMKENVRTGFEKQVSPARGRSRG